MFDVAIILAIFLRSQIQKKKKILTELYSSVQFSFMRVYIYFDLKNV